MDFKAKIEYWADLVNEQLGRYITENSSPEASIYKAMRYSLMAGGKRLRPLLALAVCEMLGGNQSEIMPYACALEMIHTYSLIHDDLPAMDNDDYRRGKLTSHKVFGEAIAILAGDALLNRAFEIMIDDIKTAPDAGSMKRRAEAASIIAFSAGTSGMIGGQVVDIESEGKSIGTERLLYMHSHKTGALMSAPLLAAAALCNGSPAITEMLKRFAEYLGLLFQIKDDILDVQGTLEVMGKPSGSDEAAGKSTFVTEYGLDGAIKKLDETTEKAITVLEGLGEKSGFLKELTSYLARRDK